MNIVEIINNAKNENISLLESVEDSEQLRVDLLDVEDFIKKNNIQEITEPIAFLRDGVPTTKGLLSNEIFGITKVERAGIYGYIELGDVFMHPLCYKMWSRMDARIREIAHGTKKFSINNEGDFVEDPNGRSGIKFIKDNINRIKIASTGKFKREQKIQFLEKNKHLMFMTKYMVMPAFYRDSNSSSRTMSIGQLNKFYESLIISVRSLTETQDFGLSMSDAVRGRIQETILNIYNCVCGTNGSASDGIGLSGKGGIVHHSVMSLTSDYGSRLVLSAPELKVERLEDMMVDMNYSALPLSSAITNFYPFIMFHVKRFFENQFQEGRDPAVINDKGEIEYVRVKDPLIAFSDDVIKAQINKFIHGFSNRFIPVTIPLENGRTAFMAFKGKSVTPEQVVRGDIIGESPLINRKMTWCDVLYMAAFESVKDKNILITRYPIDSCYNQFPTRVNISTIKDTEKVFVNGQYYPFYPRIRDKDINSNTSNRFIDTLMISNLFLKAIGGDYDGDQASVKGVWTREANEELDRFRKSKTNYIDGGGINLRVSTNEAIQSLYNLTKILPQDKNKLVDPVF